MWKSSVTMISHGATEPVEVQESVPLNGMLSAQLTMLCWLSPPQDLKSLAFHLEVEEPLE